MISIDIKKYGGRQVAIFRNEIVAVGNTLGEVLDHAKDRFPDEPLESFKVFAVPRTLHAIYVTDLSVRHHHRHRRRNRGDTDR